MKKASKIAASTAFAVFAVADLVHEVVTNDPMGYYSADPRRLLYVAVIAVAGGLAALGFSRLSPRRLQQAKLLGWGAAASIMSAFVGYLLSCFLWLASLLGESGVTVGIPFLLLLFTGIAAYLWFEFTRAWKTANSR